MEDWVIINVNGEIRPPRKKQNIYLNIRKLLTILCFMETTEIDKLYYETTQNMSELLAICSTRGASHMYPNRETADAQLVVQTSAVDNQ